MLVFVYFQICTNTNKNTHFITSLFRTSQVLFNMCAHLEVFLKMLKIA